jgi:prepilin-type N-terminal cleavage/methylation domain-containing protein
MVPPAKCCSANVAALQRRSGFTLLEILISTAILTIGLVSIVALFPVAINVGRQVIESSNSVVIGQSVAEAIRDSIRNRKRFSNTGNAYFVFQHDGVTDTIPADSRLERPSQDYYVLLPQFRAGRRFSGTSQFRRRFAALSRSAKTFVYPETDAPPNGNGDPAKARNDAYTEAELRGQAAAQKRQFRSWYWKLRPIKNVYRLGENLTTDDKKENLPNSFGALADIQGEVLRQYSYAFAIIPSFFDANLASTREYIPAGKLYHVRVMVFRRFPKDLKVLENIVPPEPVYKLDFEVSL